MTLEQETEVQRYFNSIKVRLERNGTLESLSRKDISIP